MSKKILALVLAFCMVATLGFSAITASAAIPESPWTALDLDAFKAGTDANWVKGNSNTGVAVETLNGVTGIVAVSSATNNLTSGDPAFRSEGATSSPTSKRAWGTFKSRNAITSTDTDSYVLTFRHQMAQGMYAMAHGGAYVYLRTGSVGDYLDNRFAIMVRRYSDGKAQIGLKPANGSAAATG